MEKTQGKTLTQDQDRRNGGLCFAKVLYTIPSWLNPHYWKIFTGRSKNLVQTKVKIQSVWSVLLANQQANEESVSDIVTHCPMKKEDYCTNTQRYFTSLRCYWTLQRMAWHNQDNLNIPPCLSFCIFTEKYRDNLWCSEENTRHSLVSESYSTKQVQWFSPH